MKHRKPSNQKVSTKQLDKYAPDYNHWAKRLDTYKHIYAERGIGGTLCGSVAYCLGNNYSTYAMPVCPKCLAIQAADKKEKASQ